MATAKIGSASIVVMWQENPRANLFPILSKLFELLRKSYGTQRGDVTRKYWNWYTEAYLQGDQDSGHSASHGSA